MKSIIKGDTEFCFLCYKRGIINRGNEVHHMIFGTGKRKLADEDGLTVHLCSLHHKMLHDRGDYKRDLQELAQATWMEHYNGTKEDFIRRYGISYL